MINIKTNFDLRIVCYFCLQKFTIGKIEEHIYNCLRIAQEENEGKIILRDEYQELLLKIRREDFKFSLMSMEKYFEEFNRKAIEINNENEEDMKISKFLKIYESSIEKIPVFINEGKSDLISVIKNIESIFAQIKKEKKTLKEIETHKLKDIYCFICSREIKFWSFKDHFKFCSSSYIIDNGKANKMIEKPNFNIITVILKELTLGTNSSNFNSFDYIRILIKEFNIQSKNSYSRNTHLNNNLITPYLNKQSNNIFVNNLEKQINDFNIQSENNVKTDPISFKCFICGISYSFMLFEPHLKKCEVQFLKNNSNSLITKPENLSDFLDKISKGMYITKEIEQFNALAEECLWQNICKKCSNCGRKFNPESFIKHSKSCNSTSNSTSVVSNQKEKKLENKNLARKTKQRSKNTIEYIRGDFV